jgi:outer membrane lipoprotein-sorting protein
MRSRVPSRPAARWALPAGLAAAVVGAGLVAPVVAAAEPDLPDRSAAELLVDLQSAEVEGFSGTLVHRADLGLPSLPGLTTGGGGPGGSTDPTALLDGEHVLRVWAVGPDRSRVSLHGEMGELTVVADGEDLWTWSSDDRTATRYLLPDDGPGTPADDLRARVDAVVPPLTPREVSDLVLEALDPSTDVSVGEPVRVAGRPAHQLVLTPRAEGSLVASVRIAVDAADRVPTRVQVFAVGHDAPALEVGFTSLSLVPPDEDTVTFTPPPGATVEEVDLSEHAADGGAPPDGDPLEGWTGHDGAGSSQPGGQDRPSGPGEPPVTVVGDGWASVLVAALPPGALEALAGGAAEEAVPPADGDAPFGPRHGGDGADDGAASAAAQAALLLGSLPVVEGEWGSGRLLTSRLLTVLVTDDGRVLVGAVDRATLEATASAVPRPGPAE